ncbi:hypothetical protein GMD78_05630 [Ornithinibacillus sp. L9]|uniref:Lipoprotein n=1 Tax=Ornithinibacillus caprae TaxID=2678566 RepID=A0A6N8FJE6_9BACI|nr:hypothetical protein [Ornithinibacillus caprae]MUK87879.1 hypothetical protein [Ornithinibacillus caprae]
MRKNLLLVMLFILLVGCKQGSVDSEDIKDRINEELGISPYIPKTDFPIGTVILSYDVNGNPWSVDIEYVASKEEPLDDEAVKQWEENELKKIIYGDLYYDESVIQVSIYKEGSGTLADAELIEIDDREVQYQLVQEDLVVMAVDVEDYGYSIRYHLPGSESEEDAKSIVEDIIRNAQ